MTMSGPMTAPPFAVIPGAQVQRALAAGNGRSPSWSRTPTGYTAPATR